MTRAEVARQFAAPDWALLEAMREVDAIGRAAPPIAPSEPPPTPPPAPSREETFRLRNGQWEPEAQLACPHPRASTILADMQAAAERREEAGKRG